MTTFVQPRCCQAFDQIHAGGLHRVSIHLEFTLNWLSGYKSNLTALDSTKWISKRT
jgi:hypothetical protein